MSGPVAVGTQAEVLNGLVSQAIQDPYAIRAEACRRNLFVFVQEFWDTVIMQKPVWNWHIAYLCHELQIVAERVGNGLSKEYDLIINVPPGTTKSTLVVQMLPAWTWTRWPWMRHVCGSYSGDLATEHGTLCRQIVNSERYGQLFPYLRLDPTQDAKTNFRLQEHKRLNNRWLAKGGRIGVSVGGTVTGKHGDMIEVDDPINPKQAISPAGLKAANDWMDQTLSTRKVDKAITPTILVMQRLNDADPTGNWLTKAGKRVRHINLPGVSYEETKEGRTQVEVKPEACRKYYVRGLLDPVRLSREVLEEMRLDLGEYGYAGQVLQNPAPPEGGMFKTDTLRANIVETAPFRITSVVRYWDKAGTQDGGAYTAGVKMAAMENGEYIILDVCRGQWGPDRREAMIRQIAEQDGRRVRIFLEQEPGSGGKDSAHLSVKNLAGYAVKADRPVGDKIYRADPFAAQCNAGHVYMLRAEWNDAFLEELRLFPNGTYKDQVDGGSGAFTKLAVKKRVGALRPEKENTRRKH